MKTLSALFFCFFSTVAHAIQIKINYSPISNLVYQIDCVSGYVPSCSDNNYRELWAKEFLKDDADKTMITAWTAILSKYKANAILVAPIGSADIAEQDVDLSEKIRIASFEVDNLEDYMSRLDLVLLTGDRIEIEKIVRHFYPRFETWWNKEASKKGKSFVAATDTILKSKDIQKKVNQFAHFYEAHLPSDFVVTLNLFFRPEFVKEPTSGQQIEAYAVSEFIISEKPEERMDVIIHELCHFFYSSVPPEKLESLKRGFNSLKTLSATGANNIINETLATTFGNGMISKIFMSETKWKQYFEHKNSFYNNHYIDTAAKSILPWMEEWIEQGKTLYDPKFITKYMEILEKSLGKELEAPRILLSDMIFIGDETFAYAFENDLYRHLFMTDTSWGNWKEPSVLEKLKKRPDVTALIVVHPSNFKKLLDNNIAQQRDIETIKTSLQKEKAILYGLKRSPSAMTYIIAANNHKSAVKLIEFLGKEKFGFVGVFKVKK